MLSCCNNVAVEPTDRELDEMASPRWISVDDRHPLDHRPKSCRPGFRNNYSDHRQDTSPRQKKLITALIIIVVTAILVIAALGIYIAVSHRKAPTPTTTPASTTAVSDTLVGDARLDGLEFTDVYNESTSFEYKQMKEGFCRKIAEVLQGGILNQWYSKCEVDGFSPGSVIVHYKLTVVRPTIHQVWHSLEYLMVSALVEDLERPNSTLGAFTSTFNTSLSFGPLRNITESATPRPTSTTPRVDACASQPCQNGGTCTQDDDGYKCTCPVCGCSQGGNSPTCGLADDICVNRTEATPHPYDCNKYVQCANSAIESQCELGLVFNPDKGSCSLLANTACAQPVVTGDTTVTTAAATTTGDTTVATAAATTTGVDACASQPCQNGGTCTQDDDGYKCTCPVCGCSQGGKTPTCGRADDICVNKTQSTPHPHNCHKYVTCSNSVIAAVSQCPGDLVFNPDKGSCAYFVDTPCAQPVVLETTSVVVTTTADTRTCSSVTCLNGGTCEDTSPGVRCLCPSTHTGSTCETEIISCAETTCQHGANCSDGSSGFHCDCPVGYSGLHCETEIDECASSPCQHASTCVDHVNGYTCLCGHYCGCANQAAGPNCEKDPVTCDGFSNGDYIPDPDNCALSHRCLLVSGGLERTPPGVANCTSGSVFVQEPQACVYLASCANYTYFHPQP
ncbi:hypothetical protein LSAT2_012279 [Lamellibrachia satsuma]|nr:hypothetical protein LSAT2_012279 [Lamellibrachia satsuma]